MKTYLKIVILLLIVSVSFTACTKKTGTITKEQQGEQSQNQESNIKGSLKDLLGMGKNIKCTFQETMDGYKTTIETYVSGDNVRSTVTQETSEGKMIFNTIMKSNWMYTWDNTGNAYKMDLEEMKKLGEEYSQDEESADIDLNKNFEEKFNYDCKTWIPDQSKFKIPSDLNFIDQNQLIKDTMEDVCGTCEMMPTEEAKAECLSNFNCN